MSHHGILGGSWDLVSKVISTLIGVRSIVTLIITLVTKSHDPLSSVFLRACLLCCMCRGGSASVLRGASAWVSTV